MHDRQLRLAQRPAVQVSKLPVVFTLTRGGVPVTTSSATELVTITGSITFFKCTWVLSGTGTGALSITTTGLGAYPVQVFGTVGLHGSSNVSTGALYNTGTITCLDTLPDSASGDVLTLQGAL